MGILTRNGTQSYGMVRTGLLIPNSTEDNLVSEVKCLRKIQQETYPENSSSSSLTLAYLFCSCSCIFCCSLGKRCSKYWITCEIRRVDLDRSTDPGNCPGSSSS